MAEGLRVMGLDVSVTATGIAVTGLDPNEIVKLPTGWRGARLKSYHAERVGYPLPEDASFEDRHRRIEAINARVIDVAIEFKPDLCAIEDIVFANEGNAKAQIWGMNLIVQHTVFKLGIPARMVPLDTWRAWLGVSWQSLKREFPNASGGERSRILKRCVRERLKDRFGIEFEPKEHNEAEAFAIAQFAAFRAAHPDAVQQGLGIQMTKRRGRR